MKAGFTHAHRPDMHRRTYPFDCSVHRPQKARQEADYLQEAHSKGDRVICSFRFYCGGGRWAAYCEYAQNSLGVYDSALRAVT